MAPKRTYWKKPVARNTKVAPKRKFAATSKKATPKKTYANYAYHWKVRSYYPNRDTYNTGKQLARNLKTFNYNFESIYKRVGERGRPQRATIRRIPKYLGRNKFH